MTNDIDAVIWRPIEPCDVCVHRNSTPALNCDNLLEGCVCCENVCVCGKCLANHHAVFEIDEKLMDDIVSEIEVN